MGLKNVKTISQPTADFLAISLETAKAHCFIVEDDETQNNLLSDFILTAQSIIENDSLIPYCFSQKQFEATYIYDRPRLSLPKSPVVSVDKVEKWHSYEWREIDKNQYRVNLGDTWDYVLLPEPPRGIYEKIKITFTAGHTSADAIRLDVKQAVAALTSHLFEYRGATTSQQVNDNPIYKEIVKRLRRITL